MRGIVVTVHIKRAVYILMISMIFIIVLPILIVGMGSNGKTINSIDSISRFNINNSDVFINNKIYKEPKIKVFRTKSNKIEEMLLEEYVIGVVAAEMPAEFNIEALKAQAVAARTFALSYLEEFGGTRCDNAAGADLCDTTQSQVYMSKDERLAGWPEKKREEYWAKITDAVKVTSGQVLVYDNKIAQNIRYFSTSSGKTEDAVEVFELNEPYLKSVDSYGEEESPKYKSTVKITYTSLANKINNSYPNAKVSASKLKNQIKITSPRSKGGSVKEIKLGNISITGAEFRSLLELNSANFELKFNSKDIEIITYGYGHGVGMSQWGANAMGKEGKSYNDILTHYYQGIEIKKIY